MEHDGHPNAATLKVEDLITKLMIAWVLDQRNVRFIKQMRCPIEHSLSPDCPQQGRGDSRVGDSRMCSTIHLYAS
jgi:hypothetical protein